mmetsp:Transcript_14690/g.22430  ORF Transcript_14690/g.22430 Transcript_14690/m.22430 type:complete len:291 (-) Transcript_14690:432-1304(-)
MISPHDVGNHVAPIPKLPTRIKRLNTNLTVDQVPDSTTVLSNTYFQTYTGDYNLVGRQKSNQNIRKHQNIAWHHHFQDLVTFWRENNSFPNQHSDQPKLFGWVKRQRCQYKLYQRGKESTMTQERIDLLNSIGFVWNQQETLWESRFKELVDFKKKYGNCDVPYNYEENPKLANWVKIQRRQYVLYQANSASNITFERIKKLEKLGFTWSNGGDDYLGHNASSIHVAAVEFDPFDEVEADDFKVSGVSDAKTSDEATSEQFQEGSQKVLDGVETKDYIRVWSEIWSDLVE